MGTIQEIYKEQFNPRIMRARFSQTQVIDHTRALIEMQKKNAQQMLNSGYFPMMHKIIQQFVKTCEICKTEKYERNPQKYLHVKTPIPKTFRSNYCLMFLLK